MILPEQNITKLQTLGELCMSTGSNTGTPKITNRDDEIKFLQDIVCKSLNAKSLADQAMENGFEYVSEDFMGLRLAGQFGDLIVSVLASHHASNIYNLVYGGRDEGVVSIVKEGSIENE
jgi:hypothetical protein